MTLAATLLANSIPVAGIYVAAEKRDEARELFILAYVGAVGLLGSAIAHFGGFLSTLAYTH